MKFFYFAEVLLWVIVDSQITPTSMNAPCRSSSRTRNVKFDLKRARCRNGECTRAVNNVGDISWKPVDDEEDMCKDHLDEMMPVPVEPDCSLFAMCKDGIPTIMRCPFGTILSEKLFCDWPANSNRSCRNAFDPHYPTGLTRSHTPVTQPSTRALKSSSQIHCAFILIVLLPMTVVRQ